MHVTRSMSLSRFLTSIAALALLAGLLLLPDQAHAQNVPTISGMGSLSFPEGTTTSTVLHTYTAADTDPSTTFTWTLEGVDAGDFVIDAGELKFANVPNFEMPADTPSTGQSEGDNVYNVTVKVADNESTPMSATLPVTVTVTNVNEAPSVSGTSNKSEGENRAVSTPIGNYTAADPDASTTLMWTLEGEDADDFRINPQRELKLLNVPDYESPTDSDTNNVYNVTVKVTDNGGLSATADFTLTITNVDEAGTVTISGTRTGGGQMTATVSDPDGTPTDVTWQWARGNSSGGPFTDISGATSATYPLLAVDVGKFIQPTASYTDPEGSGKSATAMSGQVLAGNTKPYFSSDTATRTLPENSAAGVNVVGGTVIATDTDTAVNYSRDTLTYTLTGTDAGSFEIDAIGAIDTGDAGVVGVDQGVQIKTKTGTSHNFNFEATKKIYTVTVNVSDSKDSAGYADTEVDDTIVVTISLTNVNEAGTVTIAGSLSGGEELAATLTDLDGTTTSVTWQWARGDSSGGTFVDINGETSADYTTVADDVGKYLRATASYTDPEGSGKSANAVTGQIGASNSDPTFSSGTATRTLPENSGAGVNVVGGTVAAMDSNSGDTLTYGLSGTDAGSFDIDTSNGQIKTKNGITHNFDFESTKKTYDVTVSVHDGKDAAGNPDTTTIDDTIDVTITITNVNEAPRIVTGTTGAESEENRLATEFPGYYRAEDPDASTTLTWSLEGADANFFTITKIINAQGEDEGWLRFRVSPNYEMPEDANGDNMYKVTVSVSDGSLSDTWVSTISVTNVNEAPEITSPPNTATFAENATGTVGDFDATDVDASTTLTWSVEPAADGDKFDINSTTGALTFKNAPNFETPNDVGDTAGNNTYVVTVKVEDNGVTGDTSPMSDTHTITVTVTDVNEAPTITTAATTASVAENSTAVLTLAATDVDASTTLLWSVESAGDGGEFNINSTSGVLTFKTAPDFESPTDTAPTNSYVVTVKVTDNGSPTMLSDMHTVTVNVTNVNEAPVITSPPATRSIPENSTAVFTFSATDVDDPDTQTWSVESDDDGSFFQIDSSGALSFIDAPNFEDKQDAGGNNVYNVTVKVTDAGSRSATRDVAVTVTNVNEAPVITTDSETFTAFIVGENTETSVVIKTYTATDVDADTTLTWSLEGNDAGDFTITKNAQGDGELKFANVPNFELPDDADEMNDYDITVKVKDDGIPSNRGPSNQLDDTVSVTVDVEDINETPVVSGNATPSFEEIEFDVEPADLGPSDYLIGTYTAYDDDGDSVTWDLKGRDSEHFTIDATSGALSFSIIPDYENPVDRLRHNIYEIKVTAFDGLDAVVGVGEYTVTVTVTNVDETPEITTTGPTHATPSFAEIEYDAMTADLAVADYAARDEEDETVTWSLGGADMEDFTIDSASGVLSFASRPDYEAPTNSSPHDNVYEIIVKATDATPIPNTREYPVAVTVTNVDETPEIGGPSDNLNFPETLYDSSLVTPNVAIFTARDEEDQNITWSLTGDDAGQFTIMKDPVSGVGTVTFNNPPNFEAPADEDSLNTYGFTVEAFDGTNTGTWDYAVTVTDVNETPKLTGLIETAITLDEHDANETYTTPSVATYTARDEEGEVTWTLTGTDSGDFAIDGNGVVTFAVAPNWEDPDDSNDDNVYTFTVVATDILSGASRLTVTTDVTVTVEDVEEAGAVTGDNQNPGVRDTIIFTLTDPDGGIVTGLYPDGFEWQIESRVSEEAAWQELLAIPINNSSVQYHYEVEEEDTGNQLRAVVASYQDRRGPGKLAESEPTTAVTADPIANAPPRFLGPGPQFVPEGPAGQNVGDPPEVSDRENDTLTFGLTGVDSGYFEIDASTGQIRTTQELDYETTTTSLYITVTLHDGKGVVGGTGIVTDDDSVDDRKIFDITVTDVEEEGVVTLSQEEPEVGVQLEATLEDGDGDISGESWQWARSENGQIGWINISGATSSSYTPVDTDRGFYLRASVTYTDRRGAGKSAEAFTEQVFGENRRPTFPSTENGQRSIAENTAADQNVGAALTAIDADLDTLTYTLEGADAVFFNIDRVSGQIQTKEGVTYDYEAKTSYALTVRASDGAASATIVVTITVTDVLEPSDAPAEPSVTATSGSTTSLDVSWTAPTNTGRPAITNYDLRYRQGTTGDFINGPQNVTGTGTSIPGLAEATEYEVQVRASNDEGDSSWSQSGTGTTNTPTGTPHITVSTTALTVSEEDTTGDSYTVVLDTQPTADVTVTVAGHSGTGVTTNPTTLTFTTSHWSTAQTVTVTAGNDADLTNDTVTLTHRAMSADTNYNGITIDDVTVTVNDNDTAQVTEVSVTAGNAQLVVSWTAVDNATGYKVQWKSGSENYNDTNRQATITSGSTTSHTIPNLTNGVAYAVRVIATRIDANDGLPSTEVPGTPAMPTTPHITVSTTALTVTEEDTTGDSYTVVLDTQPTADVTVTVAGHSGTDVTPSPTTLTFTTSNWSTAQTVTVTAGNDADLTSDTVALTHSAMSADTNYNGITIDDVTVTVVDNDTAAGICGRTDAVRDALMALVPGANGCADVTAAHLAAITGLLDLSGQNITALAAGDFAGLTALTQLKLVDNDLTTLPDDVFDGLTALMELDLFNNDLTALPDDVFDGLTALMELYLNNSELTTLPGEVFDGLTALEILLLDNNDLTMLPARVFDGLTSLETLSLSNNELTTLPDGVFEPLTSLQALDMSFNPEAPFAPDAVALPDEGTVPIAGGAVTLDGSGSGGPWGTNVTYGWALTTSTSGVTVTFDDDTSATPVVTIPAQAEGAEFEFTLTVTGRGGTNGIASATDTATVTVTARPTTPGVRVSKTALTVTEEDTTGDSYTVVLSTQPTADVVVMVAGHAGTDVTPDPITLIFTTSNWNTARTVTVTAGNDADLTNDTVTLTHSAMSADTNYNGIAIDDVTVTVNDNDTAAGICGRADAVRDALMALIPGVSDCADVTAALLAAFTGPLDLSSQNITALAAGDFAGLTALTELDLFDNDLTTLPDDVFDGLTSLEILDLNNNDLTELPAGVFDRLTSLGILLLDNNELTMLPVGVFDRLTSLEMLWLGNNDLTMLPARVFDGLTSLETLFLYNNDLTTLPAGVFGDLTALKELDLSGNTEAPFAPDAVALPDEGTVSVAGGAVTLDGSGSGGPWGTNVTYFWALNTTASGVTVTFDNDTSATPVVTIPGLPADTELIFTLTVTGRGGTNGIATATDTAKVTATREPGVTVSRTALTVREEATTGDSYTVVLDTQPTADVTVTVAVPEGTAVTTNPTTLTFTTSNWSTAQTVTVTAGNDADLTSDTVALTHSAASADANYNGITIDDVMVRVNDNDDPAADICGRTPAVHDALMALVPGASDCADVTAAHLAAFTGLLDLSSQNITALAAGDFAGLTALTELDLFNNDLTTLPDDVFDGLTSLEILSLNLNALTELSAGVFDGLTSLEILLLDKNDLTTLPAGVFDRLTSLEMLWLDNNGLTMLPVGVFTGLTSLETLFLYNNELTTLPAGVFDDLTALKALRLDNNELTTLPAGVFDDLIKLRDLYLSFNTGVPFAPDAVALPDDGTVPVPGGVVTLDGSGSGGPWGTNVTYFWALNTTASGVTVTFDDDTSPTPVVTIPELPADTELIFTLTVTGRGGTNGIAIATDTAKVTATWEPGVTVSRTALTVREEDTTGDSYTVVLDAQPTADVTVTVAGHSGTDVTPSPTTLTFTTSNWSTAQTVTVTAGNDADLTSDTVALTHSAASADANYNGITIDDVMVRVNDNDDPAADICGRTPAVHDALMALVPGASGCADVTAAHLAAFTGLLDLSSQKITALAAGDFAGLTALTELQLYNNKLTTLPAGVFDELTALTNLNLYNNELTELPAGVFDRLPAVVELNLNGNELTMLPAGVFDRLPALEILFLDNNELTELPAGVFDRLPALEILFLYNNELTTLPAGVFDDLIKLTSLNLSANELTTLPDDVFEPLILLTELWLRDNPGAPFAPDAVALPDERTVPIAGGAVTLDGSGSGGPWGTNVTYFWALNTTASGVTVTFDDDTSPMPVVTIPELPADTELIFTLTVTGRGGTNGIDTDTDTAKVTATDGQ